MNVLMNLLGFGRVRRTRARIRKVKAATRIPPEPIHHTGEEDIPQDPSLPPNMGFWPRFEVDEDMPAGPYSSSDEHLWDEVRRIEQLLRGQTLRWWLTAGADKPQDQWGMYGVSFEEVQTFLQSPFRGPNYLPDSVRAALEPLWEYAHALGDAITERRAHTPTEVRLRIELLKAHFHLTDLERDILLVCLLPELDSFYRRLFRCLRDDTVRTEPSVELALRILRPLTNAMGNDRAAFEVDGPLLAHRLLVVNAEGEGDAPLSMRSIRLDDRIAGYLLGSDAPDARLVNVLSDAAPWTANERFVCDNGHKDNLESLAWWVCGRKKSRLGAVLLLHGPLGSGKLKTARALCKATRTPLLIVDVEAALRAPVGWEQIVALSYREAALREAAICWSGCELLLERDQPEHRWERLVTAAETAGHLTFLSSKIAWYPTGHFSDPGGPFLHFELPMPGYALRCRMWEAYLPPSAEFKDPPADLGLLAEMLANSFQLTPGQIVDAVATARAIATRRDPHESLLTVDDLREGCRRQSGRRLLAFANRIEPRTGLTFDALILPWPNKLQLAELQTRIRLQSSVQTGLGFEKRLSLGKGLIALFTGSSGTGKTMAAEILAGCQGVDLYKVDLSAVVSKYVGETEKHLKQVFAEAADANAIIFFDEADALFGKRGEVKEAQDRWANMEVNYLLQQVEEYAGVVILASNLRQNIDEAFMRRIHLSVEFPFPDAQARGLILKGMFPPGVDRPRDSELCDLAERFKLAGGSWKNVVLDAAFRAQDAAGDARPAIRPRHLVDAIAREYQKLGKPITRGEFGEIFYDWVQEDLLRESPPSAFDAIVQAQ